MFSLPSHISYFLLAVAFSFFGSIPPATGNLITVQVAVTKSIRAALIFALGEVILEFIYGYFALKISDFIAETKANERYLNMAVVPVFLSLSVYYFLNKKKINQEELRVNYKASFLYGLLIGLLNPLALPYWIFYFSYFYSNGWIEQNNPAQWALLAGIPAGSFLLLTVYAFLGKKIMTLFKLRIEALNRSIALIFLLLACFTIIRLLVG